MTEDEAKTKWCPFVRLIVNCEDDPTEAGVSPATGFNRAMFGNRMLTESRCIGSACMAWRTQHFLNAKSHHDVRSYCGLAGTP